MINDTEKWHLPRMQQGKCICGVCTYSEPRPPPPPAPPPSPHRPWIREAPVDNTPPLENPIWRELTKPLEAFLSRRRSSSELLDWRRSHDLTANKLIQLLACLSVWGRIVAIGKGAWEPNTAPPEPKILPALDDSARTTVTAPIEARLAL